MNPLSQSLPQQPIIVKYTQAQRTGVQSQHFSRNAIGYIQKGKRYIYYGDTRYEIGQGSLYYLGTGTHYTEDVGEGEKPFEQIVFYYSQEQLSRIMNNLNIIYQLQVANDHDCPNCHDKTLVVCPAWSTIKNFYNTINQYLKDNVFSRDETVQTIKMTELIYLILTQPECCLKSKILENIDLTKESFEQIIHKHIFIGISMEELAEKCNCSLTTFKKNFRKHFYDPPHKWFVKQRLMHARLLLISTDKSISEIGMECKFPNNSHFIKLFKKEYEMTPATYRNRHEQQKEKQPVGYCSLYCTAIPNNASHFVTDAVPYTVYYLLYSCIAAKQRCTWHEAFGPPLYERNARNDACLSDSELCRSVSRINLRVKA